MIATLAVLALAAHAQVTSDPCITDEYLPTCCVGSYPNLTYCQANNWYVSTADPCKPSTVPLPNQMVYIKDEVNFCINLPNPNSTVLKNNYYLKGLLPTIVQAEGYVQSYCYGSYLPTASLPLPAGAIRSAHVLKNTTVSGLGYYQIHGVMDCDILQINCTQSYPGASVLQKMTMAHILPAEKNLILELIPRQMETQAILITSNRLETALSACAFAKARLKDQVNTFTDNFQLFIVLTECDPGLPCDLTQDTAGCIKFMGVSFTDGFTYTDASTGAVSSTQVSLASLTSAATASTAASAAAAKATGTAQVTTTKSAANGRAAIAVGAAVIALTFL
ncbi:hypothetical protein HDU84_005600 [Entophlyctis sp. JEL0112]|nr:hypothetical protein HDU84_005600 [Entophlyctis sp. JEL0112]